MSLTSQTPTLELSDLGTLAGILMVDGEKSLVGVAKKKGGLGLQPPKIGSATPISCNPILEVVATPPACLVHIMTPKKPSGSFLGVTTLILKIGMGVAPSIV